MNVTRVQCMLPTASRKVPTNTYDDGMAEAQKTRSAHGMDGQQSKINQLVCNKRAWESETATSYWHNPYFDPREKNQWENSRIIQSCRCRAIQSVFHDMLSVISQLSIIAGSPHLPIIGFFGCLINVTLFYPTNDDLAFNQKTLQSDLEPNLTRSSPRRLLQRHSHTCPCRWTVGETQSFRQMALTRWDLTIITVTPQRKQVPGMDAEEPMIPPPAS
ncbi:hypothetical protein BofuT4_P129680.1 [Botrytis cinerea T4]|uniref:Uncharacterized protein n=1 Tax=Botryotinia fuckeliana (strain T4) TaxID=999810 RepID=G2YRM0_BOTF4|nr:hypothetical protein BofuT4_P129680.1 [Botrytis cinerea T4]